MTWEYSGDPSESQKDAVRFLVGDTSSNDPLVQDEEIEWALIQRSNIYSAASLVASGIATNLARLKISVKIGPISEDYGNRARFYANRASELEKLASSLVTLDVSVASSLNTDGTEKSPIFIVGMHDLIVDATEELTNE